MKSFVQKKVKCVCVTVCLLLMTNLWIGASDTPDPDFVNIPGSFQDELGAPGDWQPEAPQTRLVYDSVSKIWSNSFTIPAGDFEYKAALNNGWGENYGRNAARGGANLTLSLAEETEVKFYYDHETHLITDNINSVIATLPGSFLTHLGASGDWQPGFLGSWLKDPDGDGIYTFTTSALPAGNYQCKVAINEGWDENYGENGVPGGSNYSFTVPSDNSEIFFSYNAATHILEIMDGAPKGNLAEAEAVWVSENTIAWNVEVQEGYTALLSSSYEANLSIGPNGVTGGEDIILTYDAAGLTESILAKFPHLANYSAFTINEEDCEAVKTILKGQFAVSLFDEANDLADATALQIAGVLDDLYACDKELGVTYAGNIPSIRLWAPTAQSVKLHLFDDAGPDSAAEVIPMELDPQSGTWSITGDVSWNRKFYLYEVQVFVPTTLKIETNLVTDPYSFSLSANSLRSQIVNLYDNDLKPANWDSYRKPYTERPEDIVIYEMHIRDFSIQDQSVPEIYRGTYKAFTMENSFGMDHLENLQSSGLTHVHLMPTFDYATTNEIKAQQKTTADLSPYAADSDMQQSLITEIKTEDGYNWGYDPLHYTVPEGGYATDPEGTARINEFREMVQALNRKGLKVVMDVVYNHTSANGQDGRSVLDRIVPGYYHRLSSKGYVENSTCTSNTASENAMMEKLIIDSILTWVKAYKVDAFRFDLMGHHMKANMEHIRDAVSALTLEKDGVDGSQIYIYGEGWNFGEVADNARGVNATQINMKGTGIGTFNDRIRDALRGGSPVRAESILEQGFVNGIYYDSNGFDQGDELAKILLFADQIRVGLTGNLADYTFIDCSGDQVKGSDINYGGAPAGYTADPQEAITYVAAHDNRTLFDETQLKAPGTTTMADKVRIQNLANGAVGYSQGVVFYHAGQDIMRSKSMCNDSYDSGDWFNALDFSLESTNWGKGLPIAEKNESQWPVMKPLLADPQNLGAKSDREKTAGYLNTILKIRKSSPLFRLETAEEVQKHLSFLNTGADQIPGLIVMELDDEEGEVDENYRTIVVLINALNTPVDFGGEKVRDAAYMLHPELPASNDEVVKTAVYNKENKTFTIPARTAAVFVARRELPPVPEQIGAVMDYIQKLIDEGAIHRRYGRLLIWRLYYANLAYEYGMYSFTRALVYGTKKYTRLFIRYGLMSRKEGKVVIEKLEDILSSF